MTSVWIRNRQHIACSAECSCFYCFERYPSGLVTEYTDNGETAICPMCGIDAVIPDILYDDILISLHSKEGWGKDSAQMRWQERSRYA
jgi:hypothetical protein